MLWFIQQGARALKIHRIIKVYDFSNIPTTEKGGFCFLNQKGNEMKNPYLLLLSFASLLVCSDGWAVLLCEECTDASGMCLRTGPSCCAPCNTGGVVIPTKCGIGYYGTYPNCTKCPAGPNGEPTTSLGTSLTVSGCYIEIGTDFEDGTGYGEYVKMCHPF